MINDLVQRTIEGTFKDYYAVLGYPFIDKCSFCGNYERIVSQNSWGVRLMCSDCWDSFYNATCVKLKTLRKQYKERNYEVPEGLTMKWW